jgi:hypothetical protein
VFSFIIRDRDFGCIDLLMNWRVSERLYFSADRYRLAGVMDNAVNHRAAVIWLAQQVPNVAAE